MRSMSLVNSETLASSSRAEWPAVLHNICVLHNVVRLRSQYQLVGWNTPAVINPAALELCVSVFFGSLIDCCIQSHQNPTGFLTWTLVEGGVNIHIFLFYPTSFFSNQL